jgi:phosphoribosylformylglycinamidine synthase
MSGSFNDIDVPPTLVSFAVDVTNANNIVTPEFKKSDNKVVRFDIPYDKYDKPVYEEAMKIYKQIHKMMKKGYIESAYAVGFGGTMEALAKMCFGNHLGIRLDEDVRVEHLAAKRYGSIIAEIKPKNIRNIEIPSTFIGEVIPEPVVEYRDDILDIDVLYKAWQEPLEKVFPTKTGARVENLDTPVYRHGGIMVSKNRIAVPKVFIPVFPGTNCEYDSTRAFEKAGAQVITKVFKNMSEQDIRDSVEIFEKAINESQIIMFPGGFSAGDEPDGSAKFFATAFRNAKLQEAVMKLLNERDGLALGICNGFQALIKLGLVPYGEIKPQTADSPTLTTNSIGRHVSKTVYTTVVTNKSPWLLGTSIGETYAIPASHGEGRFVASEECIKKLFENGQVATQYADPEGNPTMDERYNPNGSYYAIEGILSPDGRVLGKMAHSERIGQHVAKNVYLEQDQRIFKAGVRYFK